MEMPFESIFGAVAKDYLEMGWSVFPQENSGDRRLPGKVNGRIIRLVQEYDLANRLPDAATLDLWRTQCSRHNVACVFGPASGNVFAVDIDVTDVDMAFDIRDIAEDVFGRTEFIRIGMAPKLAMLYRFDPSDGQVHSQSRLFAKEPGLGEDAGTGAVAGTDNGLEIISTGKILTFYGRHHKTGGYFRWIGGKNPMTSPPSAVPRVTPAMVHAFFETVEKQYPFHRSPQTSFTQAREDIPWTSFGRVRVPGIARARDGAAWQVNDAGMVVNGREAYLTNLVYRTISGNDGLIRAAQARGGDAMQRVKGEILRAVVEFFSKTAKQGERWSGDNLRRETASKVSRIVDRYAAEKLRSPEVQIQPTTMGKSDGEDAGMSFLRPRKERSRTFRGYVHPLDKTEAVAIDRDRQGIADKIKDGLDAAFRGFLNDVYRHADEAAASPAVHIVKAPTGAGKTSQCLRAIASDVRTYEDVTRIDDDGTPRTGRFPFVMLLPTYNNIEELRVRCQIIGLDARLSDNELLSQARLLGIFSQEDAAQHIQELRQNAMGLGLRTMVYSGKVRGGCLFADKMTKLTEAGISASSLCFAKVKVDNQLTPAGKSVYKDVYCEHYNACPAIEQRRLLNEVHLVFLPHSFMSMTIPDELKQCRAIIADERIHHLFLHSATFDAEVLTTPRKPPRLKKELLRSGFTPQDLLSDRSQASHVALDAMRTGKCPAQALFEYRGNGGDNNDAVGILGLRLVESALYVCGNMLRIDGSIYPGISNEELEAVCSRPTGRHIREEYRFWKIIEERLLSLVSDNMRREAIAELEGELKFFQGTHDFDARQAKESALARLRVTPWLAKGEREMRIQLLSDITSKKQEKEVVRISWRTQPNWQTTPTLLLDASAAPEVIAKIWGIKPDEVVLNDIMSDIGRVFNIKIVAIVNQTFSNASIVSSRRSGSEGITAARNLSKVRQAISTVSANFAHGRVVAGTNIVLREIINRDWSCPQNVDWCHFGAMRGLDMFKNHSAAISIGRMELPIRVVDGLVAALTYDDDYPEDPFDIRGDGRCPDDRSSPLTLPMGEEVLRVRDGHRVSIEVPAFPGRWGKLIQSQYREEELLQFVGRLRPVYRQGPPPVWFAMSSIIPESIVVDDVIHIDDLLCGTNGSLMEAIRKSGGIAEPHILNEASPATFSRGLTAFSKAMAAAGFDLATGSVTGHIAKGFHTMFWRSLDGNKSGRAFIAAYVPEPERTLSEAIERILGTKCEAFIERPCLGQVVTVAQKRPPDIIDMRLRQDGTPEDREKAHHLKVIKMMKNGARAGSFAFSSPTVFLKTGDGIFPTSSDIALSYLSISEYSDQKRAGTERNNVVEQIGTSL